MLPHALRDLPRIEDSVSFLYLERGRLEQTALGVEFTSAEGRMQIPVASVTSLLLGPGTCVTHGAVRTLTAAGCALAWTGQAAVRCYAQGIGETHKGYRLMRQAALSSDPELRLRVVERMYRARFGEPLPEGLTLQQIRGKEGARVRASYAEAAERYGVAWSGRRYKRDGWDETDPVNRALSTATACLHGVAHAAIVSAGYSAALGFIHQGKQLSFVYDIADLYKTQVAVPVAFATAAEAPERPETIIRRRLRDAFRRLKLMRRIVADIESVLDLEREPYEPDGFDPDEDPALPTPWWEPSGLSGDGAPQTVGVL
jgi:CRISPR-associated protein Cas1